MSQIGRLKRLIEAVGVHSGAARIKRRQYHGRAIIVAYHNIIGPGGAADGDPSLHMQLELFKRHLDVFQRLCDVIALGGVKARSHRSSRPAVVITFDDAYGGAVRFALPELARRGLPSTMFVPGAYVPNGTFWWDDVARKEHGLTATMRTDALSLSRGRDTDIRLRWNIGPSREAPKDLRCATLEDLQSAVAAGLVSIGSHSWSHPNLVCSTSQELKHELEVSSTWLRAHFPGSFAPYISYPYGLVSPAVRQAAAETGYKLGLRVSGGWIPVAGADPLALPRLNIPAGLSAAGLELRLSGILTSR